MAVIHEAVPALSFKPVRVEVVGSYARGCATLASDLDINLAAADWNEQVEWRRNWIRCSMAQTFASALARVSQAYDLKIDAHPHNPDQHTYDITYDLITDRFSDPGGKFPDHASRRWDPWRFVWQPMTIAPKDLPLEDQWPEAEIRFWRNFYGDRFLC
jgi:hypothetical protein